MSIPVDSDPAVSAVKSSVTSPITPTPTYGNSGVFTVQASAIINAPIDAVFNTTTNVSEFPKWNTFVPRVDVISTTHETGKLLLDTVMIFHVCMKGKDTPTRPSAEIVTVLENFSKDGQKACRAAWKSKQMGLKAERVTEVWVLEAGDPTIPNSARTQYRTWETFGGPLAYVLKFMVKEDLKNRFADWTQDLKNYCEKMEQTEGNIST